ncbi:saccharopine dehydrogenase [Decorospora gaudefroyi]|uniref:Saccharopine dehydrogenase n=1 Tax=Decorospora gaudefroyi TaxID=184978 RepID=A0A6A5KF52_9PLEO|nr:saccharopine dehydrogenase [Decorospora gaudefroyi]
MAALPCVQYLSRNPDNHITFPRTHPIALDATSEADRDQPVTNYAAAISLVPYVYHPAVIRSAIKGNTQVVTTSYLSDAVRELDDAAQSVDITVLNEASLDPGVDHLYAIKKIDQVHAKGGTVLELCSYYRGLPLGFKFPWSPRAALPSQGNSARYLKDGSVVEIPTEDLMATAAPYHVMDGYDVVAYPNSGSVPFRDFYRIPEAHAGIRGPLSYKGNSSFVLALASLGWLEQDRNEGVTESVRRHSLFIPRIKTVAKFHNEAESRCIIAGLRWIGILSLDKSIIHEGHLLDTFCPKL